MGSFMISHAKLRYILKISLLSHCSFSQRGWLRSAEPVRFSFLFLHRNDELDGQCFCGLWSDLLYRQPQQQVHHYQLCLRHQDIKTVGSQHTVHKSVRVQLHGRLQPQRKSAVRLGQQASSYLLSHLWVTLDSWKTRLKRLVLQLKLVLVLSAKIKYGKYIIGMYTSESVSNKHMNNVL